MAWQAVPGRGFPSDEDPRYIANVKMINKFFNKRSGLYRLRLVCWGTLHMRAV